MREKLIKEILELGKEIRGTENGEGLKLNALDRMNEKTLRSVIKLRKSTLRKKLVRK